MISIRGLSASYGEHRALKGVTVDIPEKQITAVIGPSGCGKSTLLRCINRLIDLSDGARVEGHILAGGADLLDGGADVIEVRRRFGLLPQKPNPLPMSIWDNVAYGPRIHGTKGRKELDRIVERCLTAAGLWDEVKDRLRAPAAALSLGQQQRLCLARGLAVEPEVLLCDEPTSSLDPLSTQHIEQHLLRLKENYTIVLVTHNIEQARRLADYVVHLYLGELVEHGPAREVFGSPREERTKAYLNGTLPADAALDLRGTKCPYNFVNARQALRRLAAGQTLRIVVDDPVAVTEVPRAMEADGHEVVGVKPVSKTEWEIALRKRR